MPPTRLPEAVTPTPALPARYALAAAQARLAARTVFAFTFALFLMLLLALTVSILEPASRWVSLLCNNAAALLLLVISLHAAQRICQWRSHKFSAPAASVVLPEPAEAGYLARWFASLVPAGFARIEAFFKAEGIWSGALAALAFYIVLSGWNGSYVSLTDNNNRWIAVAILIAALFALLVAERHLSTVPEEASPEAGLIAPVLRLVMAVQLLTLPGLIWPQLNSPLVMNLPALLLLLVAAEFMLRGLFSLFSPPGDGSAEPVLIPKSQLAAQLTWPPRPLGFLQQELHQRFGIDLRQVWAFTVLKRAFIPMVAIMLICGWLLTGLQQISATERGVYERFGRSVAVLEPGLHIGMPWPFGRVWLTENGQVHELAAGEDPANQPSVKRADAEGPAPASADRLWDATHNFDKAQIIASQSGDRQSLQIVNSDVRFMWRIGLSDKAALAATYRAVNLQELVRSTANQVLVHQFSSLTLDDVLSERRNDLAQQINRAVQQQLDSLNSGVEILSTVVEAIHPPAGAADAFHGVQAAQIAAQSLILRERGSAAEKAALAATNAAVRQDTAQINATEALSEAQATATRFAAQKNAWQQAGQVFIDELWFRQLQLALSGRPVLIIDQRIGAGSPPTLDLRDFPTSTDAARRDAPAKPAQEPSR
ncbi:FtsH protease regulator HflK [Cedecea lapagei]|uniref:FtsH protease regulator HflK n=1 Tax=Cedecea lapagei TaxID=158823 RepID=A0A447UZR5_9ENTR|nr:protease modulator HflK [Cedecea lapagei]VEB96095.1 FtsH protease regulator HflK [Cedecea lapagei]